MTQWKSTARPPRSASSPRPAAPSSLPSFGAGSLSTGVVPVVVRPVAAPEVAEHVALVLWRIRGVGGVGVTTLADGAAEFAVRLTRPVALGSDLRAAFGRDLVACRRDGERFVVDVHPPVVPALATAEVPLRAPLSGPRTAVAGPAPAAGPATPPSPRPSPAVPAYPPAPAPVRPPAVTSGPSVASAAAMLAALDADQALTILVAGADHVVRIAFGGLHRHFGRPEEGALVGRSLAEVLPLGAQQALADRVAAAVRGDRSSLVVGDLPGGRTCEFVLHPAPLGPAAPGCVVVARDVTRARQQDQVVAELTRVFDATFDGAFAGAGLVSPRGEWLRVNPALERLLGHRGTALLGTRIDDLTHGDDVAREARIRDRADRAGDPSYELEKRMRRADGEVVVVQARMTAIVVDGELRGWVAHIADGDAVARLEGRGEPSRPRGLARRLDA